MPDSYGHVICNIRYDRFLRHSCWGFACLLMCETAFVNAPTIKIQQISLEWGKLEAITKKTIPKTICTIHYILSKLEKKEREEFFRRNGIDENMNPNELIKEIVLTLLIDHNKPLCDEKELPPVSNKLSISSSNVSSLIKFDITPLDINDLSFTNINPPIISRSLSDKGIQLSFGEVKLTESDENLSSLQEYKPDVNNEPIKQTLGERDVIVLISKERVEAPIKKPKNIISDKEVQPSKQLERSIPKYDQNVNEKYQYAVAGCHQQILEGNETKSPIKSLKTRVIQDSSPEETLISQEQQTSPQFNQQQSILETENKQSSSKDYQCNTGSPKLSIKDMNSGEALAQDTGTKDGPSERMSKSSKAESIVSKVPSKVASVVRRLLKLLPKSSSKKNDLIVLKHPEDIDRYSDEFIPPRAAKGYKTRHEIIQIEELPYDIDDAAEEIIQEEQEELNGETFETGEWFEIPETITKFVKQTKKSDFFSLCQLPEKQSSKSHLDVPGYFSTLIPTTSNTFSDNFVKALKQLRSSPGKTSSTELLIDKISVDCANDKQISYEYEEKLKQRFLDLITSKNFEDDDTDLSFIVNSPNIYDVSELTSESTKESAGSEDVDVIQKIKRKKKIKDHKPHDKTEKPLKILNSDEILKKAP